MQFRSNLKELLAFEFQSLIGRNFFKTNPILFKENNYLNLGCGDNLIDGFINADFFYRRWKKNTPNKQWMLDLRYNLNCEDETFDGIYTEHTLEHLTYLTVDNLLKELHRTLKKDRIIRISVPDCNKFIKFYNGEINKNDFDNFSGSKCLLIHELSQKHGHMSIWDFKEMKNALEKAGFIDVKEMRYQQTQDKMLNQDIESREYCSVYIEAKK